MRDFACWIVERGADGELKSGMAHRSLTDLPQGEVLVRVSWTSLNYKDGLAATGHPGVAKRLPHVPGIDAVGIVEESSDPRFAQGQEVLIAGQEFGAGSWGGWSEYARVPADWIVALPDGLSRQEAAGLGVAGITAALSVRKLLDHGISPGSGEVLVTGATGGVGIIAVMILGRIGFRVVASTGKSDRADWLRSFGASRSIHRSELETESDAPLLKSRWAAAIDTVGGTTLANVLRSTKIGGCVTACGLVGGQDLTLSVHPFILRGITLCGIDTAWTPRDERLELWKRLSGVWKPAGLAEISHSIRLHDAQAAVTSILAGGVAGRTIIHVAD
ncbi:MAG: acryloyl-CoA reductase [Spirochaetota bacterium]